MPAGGLAGGCEINAGTVEKPFGDVETMKVKPISARLASILEAFPRRHQFVSVFYFMSRPRPD